MHPYIHAHVVTSLIAFINKVSGHVDSKLLSSNKEHKSQLHDQNSDLKITDHKYFRVNSPLIIAANAGGGGTPPQHLCHHLTSNKTTLRKRLNLGKNKAQSCFFPISYSSLISTPLSHCFVKNYQSFKRSNSLIKHNKNFYGSTQAYSIFNQLCNIVILV